MVDEVVTQELHALKPGRGDWSRMNCPHCPAKLGKIDRSSTLTLNVKSGYFRCYRCNTTGWVDVEQIPRVYSPRVKSHQPSNAPFEIPGTPLSSPTFRDSLTAKRAVSYLHGRNVSDEAIVGANIHYTTSGAWAYRVIVPIHSTSGKITGCVGRDITGKASLRYRNSPDMERATTMFNYPALFTGKPAILVEGCFDALPLWPHAAACLGKPTNAQKDLLISSPSPIIVMLDGDAWMEGWALYQYIKLYKQCSFVKLPPKLDPGSYTKDEMMQVIKDQTGECL